MDHDESILQTLNPIYLIKKKKSAFFAILVALDIISDFFFLFSVPEFLGTLHPLIFFISNHSIIFVAGKGKKSRGTGGIEFFLFFVFFSKARQFVSLSYFNNSTRSKKVFWEFWEVKTF